MSVRLVSDRLYILYLGNTLTTDLDEEEAKWDFVLQFILLSYKLQKKNIICRKKSLITRDLFPDNIAFLAISISIYLFLSLSVLIW